MTERRYPPQPSEYRPFLKLSGRWGGWVNPKKLKALGRRMVRRVQKVLLHKEPSE